MRAERRVHLLVSPAAAEVLEYELDRKVNVDCFELRDLLGDAAAAVAPARSSITITAISARELPAVHSAPPAWRFAHAAWVRVQPSLTACRKT